MRLPSFVGPTYSVRSITAAIDRSINLYPEVIESGTGKSKTALIGTPGLRLFTQLQSGIVRGLFSSQGRCLAACGNILYELTSDGAVAPLGYIEDGPGAVTFADSGTQIMIVSNSKAYILEGTTLTEIVSEGLPNGAAMGAFLDGYFIALDPDSRTLRISGLYDGLTWDPLDFKLKESSPDKVRAILADHGELWLFGDTHSEVWYNSGNADFPLERIPNARLELGIGAPWSAAKLDNSIFWLGHDDRGNRVVWRATGYSAVRVSNHSVEHHINRAGSIDDAVAWTYQDEGHSFYCIQFPSWDPNTELTWVYDAAIGQWHERGWWDKINGVYETHRARCHCFIWNRHLVGDRENGKVYEQNLNYYDDDGDRIRRIRIAPHLCGEMKNIFYKSFQLDMEVAVGLGVIPTATYGPDMYGKEYET